MFKQDTMNKLLFRVFLHIAQWNLNNGVLVQILNKYANDRNNRMRTIAEILSLDLIVSALTHWASEPMLSTMAY